MCPKVKKYENYMGKIVIFCFQTNLTFNEIGTDVGANLLPFWLDFAFLDYLGAPCGRLGAVLGTSRAALPPPQEA